MADDLGTYEGNINTSANSSLGGGGAGISSGNLFGLGALGIGAAGLGTILAQGESPLPGEFGDLVGSVGGLRNEAQSLESTSNVFTTQGADALRMAQNGQLTPQQQAQLTEYSQGLKNTAAQTYYGMGRNPNQDTSFISTQADIDNKINAMANEQIRTTIALGLGETQAGASFAGQALGFENAANQALIQAGQAQLQQDQNYSKSLTGAFTAIGSLLGTIGGAAIGGPAGAAVGGAAGKTAGSLFS